MENFLGKALSWRTSKQKRVKEVRKDRKAVGNAIEKGTKNSVRES